MCRGAPGLTLIELVVAIAILAVLASIALPAYTSYRDRAMVQQAVSDLAAMNLTLRQYIDDNRVPPASLAPVGASGRLDPWGRPYVYLDLTSAGIAQARKNKNLVPINTRFDLYSRGKDGVSTTPLTAAKSRDDVIVANDGAFIGLASDYE